MTISFGNSCFGNSQSITTAFPLDFAIGKLYSKPPQDTYILVLRIRGIYFLMKFFVDSWNFFEICFLHKLFFWTLSRQATRLVASESEKNNVCNFLECFFSLLKFLWKHEVQFWNEDLGKFSVFRKKVRIFSKCLLLLIFVLLDT